MKNNVDKTKLSPNVIQNQPELKEAFTSDTLASLEGKKMLLHICCAPCSVYPVQQLLSQGVMLQGFFYNPNIHPYKEYESRANALSDYASRISLPVTFYGGYGLRDFIRLTADNIQGRCVYCYEERLNRAAAEAKRGGFDMFSTTLLVSPYQKHDLIRMIGEEAGRKYGVAFHYQDFRPGFREGQKQARDAGLYMQKYCGCIFSEEERYLGELAKPDSGTIKNGM